MVRCSPIIKVPLTCKMFILVDEVVPWVKPMVILRVVTPRRTNRQKSATSGHRPPKSQPFSWWRHKENGLPSLRIANANFCYTCPLFRLRNACISSLVPYLNIGLLLDVATREVIAITELREWLARRNGHARRRQRVCTHSSGVNSIVFWMAVQFLVIIVASSMTLLDSRPLKVCA